MLVIAIVPSIIFKAKPVPRAPGAAPDTGRAAIAPVESAPAAVVPAPPAHPPIRPSAQLPAETVWVTSPLYRLGFTTRGARLVTAELEQYRSFARGDSGSRVQLVPGDAPL